MMQRLSSRSTFFYKRVFPILLLAYAAIFPIVGLVFGLAQQGLMEFLFIVVLAPVFTIVPGYLILNWFIFDLADEVWDDGEELVVRKSDREVRVPLAECINVNYERFVNPSRVTIMLRQSTEIGATVSFIPPQHMNPFKMPPLVAPLIHRIDAARLDASRQG